MDPATPACTWWNRPEEDLSSGKLESTHPSRTVVKSIEVFYGVQSVVRGNAPSPSTPRLRRRLTVFFPNSVSFTRKSLSTTSKNDPHIEELTISIAMDNTELFITNVYIPSSCNGRYSPPINHLLTGTYSLVLGDFNAHHSLWHSGTTDTRGNQLADSVSISSIAVLNTDSPTRPQYSRCIISISLSHHLVRMANTHDHELRPSAHPYRITDNCHLISCPAQNLHHPQEG